MSIALRSTSIPIRPGRTTETAIVTVFGVPVDGSNVKTASPFPAGVASGAEKVKTIGSYEGASSSAETGETATPAGSEDGMTAIRDGGSRRPGAREAVTVAPAPPAVSVTAAGETANWAAPTVTTKLVTPKGPPGSLTRTFTTFCPGEGAGEGGDLEDDGPDGGTVSTGIETGVTFSSDASDGKVTVGDPV